MDAEESAHLLEWVKAIDSLDYYQVLGTEYGASSSEITRAFHAFAALFHPDAHDFPDELQRDALQTVYQCGAEAHKVLTTPVLRTRYDLGLQKGRRRMDQQTISLPPRAVDWSRAIDEYCRSAGAKLEAQRARKLVQSGALHEAMTALENALRHDGGANLELERYLEDLALRIFSTAVVR